jgi:hypothetical protein
MNENYNFKDNDDEVRPPDNVVSEVLQKDNRSEYQKQIDEAIYLSSMEFCEQQKLQKRYEEEIIAEYYTISNERKEKFREFLLDLNKLIRFDKDTKEIYKIIEPIIDAYCNQIIEFYELDSLTYDKIFKVLKNVRTNKKNFEYLQTILIRNE